MHQVRPVLSDFSELAAHEIGSGGPRNAGGSPQPQLPEDPRKPPPPALTVAARSKTALEVPDEFAIRFADSGGQIIVCSRRFVFFLCLLNGAVSAATYRARAQLTIAPADRQHCLKIAGQRAMDCSVVDQTRAAFSAKVATMFTPTATANLELVLTVSDADIVEQV